MAEASPLERATPARPAVPGRRLLLGLLVILLVAVIPSVVVPTLMCRPEERKLDDLGVVEPFSLVDESGQPFTSEAMLGKVTIVSFIFTRCDSICPATAATIQRIQEKTFDRGRDIKLISFSVDPRYDTPDKLLEYAKRFGADPERWRFVTGDFDKVYNVVEKTFMISMMRMPDKPGGVPDIAHQGLFLLVDRALHIRGIYHYDRVSELDKLMGDARYLARTQK